MKLSIVIPLYNEQESLVPLTEAISTVMEANGYSYEIVFVDDGSTDGSFDETPQAQGPIRAENPGVPVQP